MRSSNKQRRRFLIGRSICYNDTRLVFHPFLFIQFSFNYIRRYCTSVRHSFAVRRENERANVAWNLGAMSACDEKCPKPRSDTPERPTEKASNIDSIDAPMPARNNICEH